MKPNCAVCGEPWKAHTELDECPEYFKGIFGMLDYRPHPTNRYKEKKDEAKQVR